MLTNLQPKQEHATLHATTSLHPYFEYFVQFSMKVVVFKSSKKKATNSKQLQALLEALVGFPAKTSVTSRFASDTSRDSFISYSTNSSRYLFPLYTLSDSPRN